MAQFADIYGQLRKSVLERYSAQGRRNPASAFVAFEFGTPVPDDTFRLRDAERTLSPGLAVEFLSLQSNMVPDVAESMLTRSERTIEGQYGLLLAGASATPDALKQHVRDNLANYKVPREITVLDELPRGSTGKILRNELRSPGRQVTDPLTVPVEGRALVTTSVAFCATFVPPV